VALVIKLNFAIACVKKLAGPHTNPFVARHRRKRRKRKKKKKPPERKWKRWNKEKS
jgi:hypothetical protein